MQCNEPRNAMATSCDEDVCLLADAHHVDGRVLNRCIRGIVWPRMPQPDADLPSVIDLGAERQVLEPEKASAARAAAYTSRRSRELRMSDAPPLRPG
jgi:hypothetical protein